MKKLLCVLTIVSVFFLSGCVELEKLNLPAVVTSDPSALSDLPTSGTEKPESTALPEQTPDTDSEALTRTFWHRVRVTALAVNVREQPSMSSRRIASLQNGAVVNLIEQQGEWYQIEYETGKQGFAMKKYFEEIKNSVDPEIYNGDLNIDDNVFLDALEYTGYNLKKHRDDGKMWQIVLCKDKELLGYLSKMRAGTGKTTGYEIDRNGLPDIETITKKGGLSSSALITYVYFNFLPNVKGIDTTKLTNPKDPNSAVSWREALDDWVNKGYSRRIEFQAARNTDGSLYFESEEKIPVGSVIVFKPYGTTDENARSVAIYLGKVNDFNWMMNVDDNEIRGPEMITMEHGNIGEDLAVPIEIITIPDLRE